MSGPSPTGTIAPAGGETMIALLLCSGFRSLAAAARSRPKSSILSIRPSASPRTASSPSPKPCACTPRAREIRRGIYRDFPLTFKDAGGTLREVTFTFSSVTRDGQAGAVFHRAPARHHSHLCRRQGRVVPRGDHTYVFRYRTGRQVRWFDGKPELNWNVTGNFWNFPIWTATYRLQLVDGERPLRWTAFTGRARRARHRLARRDRRQWRADGRDHAAAGARRRPHRGRRSCRPARSSRPAPDTLLWYQIFDNRRWIFGGVGFVLVLVYYLAAWNAVGRDPTRRHHHSAVPPAGGHFAGARQLHPQLGLRAREVARLHRGGAVARGARAHPLRPERRHADAEGDRQAARRRLRRAAGGRGRDLHLGERAGWRRHRSTRQRRRRSPRSATSFTTSIEAENRNRFFRRNLGYVIAGLR